jgi:hypothetical protein
MVDELGCKHILLRKIEKCANVVSMEKARNLTILEVSEWMAKNNINVSISYSKSQAAFSVVAKHNDHNITAFSAILEDAMNKMMTSVEQHLKTCIS